MPKAINVKDVRNGMEDHGKVKGEAKGKKKLLVFASTFPRWKNDTLPPFVYELSKRLTSSFDVHVLAPAFPGALEREEMDGMKMGWGG